MFSTVFHVHYVTLCYPWLQVHDGGAGLGWPDSSHFTASGSILTVLRCVTPWLQVHDGGTGVRTVPGATEQSLHGGVSLLHCGYRHRVYSDGVTLCYAMVTGT